MKHALPLALLLALSACSEYLPIAGGKLEGTVSPLPAQWSELATTEIVQLESTGEAPYSVNLWVAEVGGALHVFAGDNLAEWVKNIAANPDVRLKIGEEIFELRAIRVTDAGVFETFAQAWASKYGNRPRNENVDETYLFRLTPRDSSSF
jgi:hypothetical protein